MIRCAFYCLRRYQIAALLVFLFLVGACSEDKSSPESAAPAASPSGSPQTSVAPTNAANASTAPEARFFARSTPVTPASVSAPEQKGDITFTIDVLDVRDKIARIRGWGFRLAPPHQVGDRVTIFLVGPAGSYSALADVESRPDVSTVLRQPGMDDTGFVSLIDTSAVPPGEYTLFLRVGGADGDAVKTTNRKLTL
jgi:hypothetical protein